MLKYIFRLFDAKPPNCKWYKKIGGQTYCFNGGDANDIRRCLDEHETESLLLWEINEVSDEELNQLVAEIGRARADFERFLDSGSIEYKQIHQ